jgi:CRISPR-associated protein Csy1
MTENSSKTTLRLSIFRQTIAAFIEERKETKLKGLGGETAEKTAAKYEYHTWLADAARRVTQIQAVTHVLKATHPDARGTNLYVDPVTLPSRSEIGTHTLGHAHDMDVMGNAAALDVYKFLKLEVEGRRLLDWIRTDDEDLLAALHPDPNTAQHWADAFKGLLHSTESPASHTLAKQVYWCTANEPTDDSAFHLLQPLVSSSLAQAVHGEIDDARFGDINKAARQAFRARQPHNTPYRDYQKLVARKLGGTKPQNISQLNSERRGINYLLSSLPPRWVQGKPRHFLSID